MKFRMMRESRPLDLPGTSCYIVYYEGENNDIRVREYLPDNQIRSSHLWHIPANVNLQLLIDGKYYPFELIPHVRS